MKGVAEMVFRRFRAFRYNATVMGARSFERLKEMMQALPRLCEARRLSCQIFLERPIDMAAATVQAVFLIG